MKKDKLLFASAGMILIICFAVFTGCKKKDNKNPVGPTTPETGTMTDQDGNVYKTVKIGDQWWMAENLKVTHCRNGDAIPNVTDSTAWSHLRTGAYCDYDNNSGNLSTYGRLYNWYAVNDNRNIAPLSWHVPTDAEWQILVDFLGGESISGDKLKEIGITHWYSPNADSIIVSGFSALPGGCRDDTEGFNGLGFGAVFWSSTEKNNNYAWFRSLFFQNTGVFRSSHYKQNGYSIRLLMD